jgi:signal transduction histidine kinase
MEQAISSYPDMEMKAISRDAGRQPPWRTSDRRGYRTQILLLLAMAVVTLTVTSLSLFLVQHRLQQQAKNDLAQNLNQSVITFNNLQADRLQAIDRENLLLAELPTLKALMTSGDDLTVQDGASEFWQLSGDDLFALTDPNGRVVAAYSDSHTDGTVLRSAVHSLLQSPSKHYLLNGSSLYACSFRPIYFGSQENGSLLGYVIGGVSIRRTVRQISQPTEVDAAFLSRGQAIVSTLEPQTLSGITAKLSALPLGSKASSMLQIKDERYLAVIEDLSAYATAPLQLVVLKSIEPAERSITHTDHIILSTGAIALLVGTLLMLVLSRLLTLPLEALAGSVRAFGTGDHAFKVPKNGTREVRELSKAFAGMREEIQQTSQALLESERLATIGRMANSVSHDLRHYLAAVFANAEFLASDTLPAEERAEIFADIRTAVNGTTDMIESLLIFSRTGSSIRKVEEPVALLVEQSIALIRSHPDAEGVVITNLCDRNADSLANVDGKQMKRAIYNLLLNACQAARLSTSGSQVILSLIIQPDMAIIEVTDNGPGVPESIRSSLFEPFVSEGKQKGTGLGLTLAHCIAEEHGGRVLLLRSRAGETTFQLSFAHEVQVPSQPQEHTKEEHVDV